MSRPNPDRPTMLRDLTRWNRAGLKKIAYVDGDAAVWMEEMRLALFGLYLRGKPLDDRTPERWRDLFLRPQEDWPSATVLETQAAAVAWARLAPARPPRPESRGQRNLRLLTQYGAAQNGDQTWEIARAFARAAHVLLGHVDAFANEGYLRTATQWDNLRRLAAMLNYQPAPPASATTVVALAMKQGAGVIEVAKGLAMKHTPVTGGAPLVFETLAPVATHPDLNAARVAGWAVNATALPLGGVSTPLPVTWLTGPKTKVDPGDLLVLAFGDNGTSGIVGSVAEATTGEGTVLVKLDQGMISPPTHAEALLWVNADAVRRGEPQTGAGELVVLVRDGFSMAPGDLVRIASGSQTEFVEVLQVSGSQVVLRCALALTGTLNIQPLAQFAIGNDGFALAGTITSRMYFAVGNGVSHTDYAAAGSHSRDAVDATTKAVFGRLFKPAAGSAERGYVYHDAAPELRGDVIPPAPQVLAAAQPNPARTVTFTGKPPKSLTTKSWFVARAVVGGATSALRVVGISSGPGVYHLLFHAAVGSAPDQTEFHGPLTEALRPLHHDRNPDPLSATGPAVLTAISSEAALLLKPGHRAILHRETPEGVLGDVLATITSAEVPVAGSLSITYAVPTPTGDLDDPALWAIGDTTVLLNTVTVGHGEAKGSRLLGSGDAERPEQSFRLKVTEVSHIPSSAAEAGVVPDIDVAVDGTVWPWRDYIDVTAEGARAWSSTLTEDGEVMIRFRRRLPTGTNNVTVLRHRVGTGATGSGIPPLSFAKPMKKHPHVDAIAQPFPTSGGANREPVESLRASAPSRLAANGRAVSLDDFQRLATGLSAVWRARAVELPGSGSLRDIRLTVVPAGGAALTPALIDLLRPAILSKAIPGVRLSFLAFQPLPLHITAEVRADLTSFDAADVETAAEAALIRVLGLANRDFAQPFHVAEALAALEAVAQVETAVITSLGLGTGVIPPPPARLVIRDNVVVAIFPGADQVAFVPEPGNGVAQTVSVLVKGL